MLPKPIGKILFSVGLSLALLFSLLPLVTVFGASLTLYDGAQNSFPDNQGFVVFPPFSVVSATETLTTGGVIFDTTPNISEKIGYLSRDNLMPVLDRIYGYTVTFAVQVITETHANNNRAGFSIIVVSNDLEGIELGFWTDQVWAQEGGNPPVFTHAEGISITNTSVTSYQLAIKGNSYILFNDTTEILTGNLRNYSTCGSCGLFNPYVVPNLLFLGDDTTSAKAKIKLAYVSITTNSIPPSWVVLSGSTSGVVSTTYAFTATTSPVTATTPLTYTWQASEQTPVIHSNGLSDTVDFNWITSGAKTITVTVNNGITQVSSTHTISLTAVTEPQETFLPIILKSD
ncbi:MAG: hypothetical protein U0401_09680 [Anaerolineae bacterium]